MLKSETVYREVLEFWNTRLTQLELSKRLGISLSTVNNALQPVAEMGAVKILHRGLRVVDREKLLLFWASKRNLKRDIVYFTRVEGSVGEMEKNMPAETVYTAYTGFKFKFRNVPADYSEIYVYCFDLEKIKKRFPERKGPPNLFVLRGDRRLFELSKNNIAPLSQIFVDLWNVREWYAKEFLNELRRKIL